MRIDKYLKVARLIKRRSVANEACDQGIEIKMGERIIKVQVMAIAEHVLKNDASSLYKPLS